jgi:hypothetical protein
LRRELWSVRGRCRVGGMGEPGWEGGYAGGRRTSGPAGPRLEAMKRLVRSRVREDARGGGHIPKVGRGGRDRGVSGKRHGEHDAQRRDNAHARGLTRGAVAGIDGRKVGGKPYKDGRLYYSSCIGHGPNRRKIGLKKKKNLLGKPGPACLSSVTYL